MIAGIPRELTVSVTEEHIEYGERAECTRCPVALAINEAVRALLPVSVGSLVWSTVTAQRIGIHGQPGPHMADCKCAASRCLVAIPSFELIRAIRAFDAGNSIEPFSFVLTFLDEEKP